MIFIQEVFLMTYNTKSKKLVPEIWYYFKTEILNYILLIKIQI